MATRVVSTPSGDVFFDMGAQYFTAHPDDFQAEVKNWTAAGTVLPWVDAGANALVGVPSMNAPLKSMAAKLPVLWSHKIEKLRQNAGKWSVYGDDFHEGNFDVVITALPAEQSASLLMQPARDMAEFAAGIVSEPCWTLMAVFAEKLPVAVNVLRDCGDISWASRNSAKPGRSDPESWVIHATSAWSRSHLEADEGTVAASLLGELTRVLKSTTPEVIASKAHRWRFARSGKAELEHLWQADRGLGVCGDWLLGPRIESAWVSGHRLAQAVQASFNL